MKIDIKSYIKLFEDTRSSKVAGVWGRNRNRNNLNTASSASSQHLSSLPPSFPTPAPPQINVQCNRAGFFATPGTCTKFHRCVDFSGKGQWFSVFHFDCPPGTVFDPKLSICNHAWAVIGRPECNGIQVTQGTNQPRPGTQSPHVTPSRPTQPSSTWPPVTTRPTQTPVWQSTTFAPTSQPDNKDPVICFRDKVLRIHPHYCNMYYYCEADEIVKFTCPPGLVFDNVNRVCTKDGKFQFT